MRFVCAAALVALLGALPGAPLPEFTDWSPPVNLGFVVNSPYLDSCVAISKNGLSLYFSSNRQSPGPTGNSANRDLYVSQRDSADAPWGAPQPLAMLNTPAWDSCPALSLDEHRFYFTSPRTATCGGQDMWVSRRQRSARRLRLGTAREPGLRSRRPEQPSE